MLRPSIFGENLFDDWFDGWDRFPFFNDKKKRKWRENYTVIGQKI